MVTTRSQHYRSTSLASSEDRFLCEHDATNLVSLLGDFNKSLKVPVVAVGLAEVEMYNTLYCWSCGYTGYTKKNYPSKPMQTHNVGNSKRKPVVPAKDST